MFNSHALNRFSSQLQGKVVEVEKRRHFLDLNNNNNSC